MDKVVLEWHSGSCHSANSFISQCLPLSSFPTRSNRVAESIVSAQDMVTWASGMNPLHLIHLLVGTLDGQSIYTWWGTGNIN